MTQQENFSGFDFETVWTMAGNENYLLPELRAVEMAKTTYLTSIELLTKPDKLEYQEGEDALDVTGGEIKLVYNNGMTLVVDLEAHMVTGFDNTVVGEQTLTVSYGGKETSYQITIVPVSQPEEEIPTTVYDGVDYAAVYDYDYYHSHYPDLQDAFGDNDVAFLEHFVLCGMAEGRQASENFNVTAYRNRYPDLRKGFGNNLKSYYMHYVNNGKNEGRIATNCDQMIGYLTVYNGVDYAAVYDYNYYINLYPDLKKAYKWNEYALLQHFVEHGMDEGRQASKNFNVYYYQRNYADLRSAFNNHLESYYLHYMYNGRSEKRVANKLI